jgi:vancomycin resistance protein YoaR
MRRRAFLAALAVPFATRPTSALPMPRSGNFRLLGSFSTTFARDREHKTRAFNIELATSALDGRTIAPGATFSFNDAVGERTAAFGFEKSIVLRDGMIAEGSGGGTCQVASTFHAAALLAGLDIVARAPHTRPSAYVRMGLDATVAFGSIDLKVKNPTESAVVIRARAAEGSIEVAIEGGGPKPEVTLTSEIVERLPFARTVERDPKFADDKAHLTAFGIPGYRIRRLRTVRVGEIEKRDARIDVYPPTPEVLHARDVSATEIVVEPSAVRPLLVQLRPSTLVTLKN